MSSIFRAVPREEWPPLDQVSHCAICGKSLKSKKLHCEGCGRVCCPSCAHHHLVLPGNPGSTPVPTCEPCAQQIQRAREDVEGVIHRCNILENLLNQQCTLTETLVGDSRELRAQNDSLLREKEQLELKVKQLEAELEVAVARSSLVSPPPGTAPAKGEGGTSAEGDDISFSDNDMEELGKLEKRKKMLDMREATLKEALKKVSNDAAKIVSQRNALLEREQAMQETLTTDFLKFFEKERDRMEKMFFVELSSMTSNFTRLVKEQRLFSSPEKQKYERELSIVRKEYDDQVKDLHEKNGRVEELERVVEDLQSTNTSMCRTEPSTPLPLVSDSEIERTRNELTGQLEKQQAEWSRERKALTEELKDVHEACEQEMEKKAILIEQLDGLQQQYTVLEAKNKKELEQLTHKYELAFGAIQKEAETQKRELELLVEERFKQLHAGLDAMNQIAEKERKLLREKFFSQEQVEEMKKKITQELTSSLEAQRSTAQAANGQKECEKVKAATEKEWSGKLQSELARLRVELVGERDTSIRRLEEELETMRQKAEKAANADASGAAAKKEVKRLEEQLKESALQQLAQKRTIAALQTDVEALKIKLQSSVKSSRRSSLAPGRRSSVSPPPETESKRQLPKETAYSLALWTARRLAAVGEYNVGLFNTIQQSCMAVVEKTTGTLHADVEAFQEESRRKAQSLDRTVSAMKMLQEDLRNKADQLRQREAELSEKEVHLEEVEKTLQTKKNHIMNAAQNLREVSVRIKEREESLAR